MLNTLPSFEAKIENKARKLVLLQVRAVLEDIFIFQLLGLKSSPLDALHTL